MADNTITYILNLQDKISGKLKTIGINNDKQLATWAKVQQKVNDASNTMRNMGKTIGSLNERISALRAQREWIPANNISAIRATNHEIQRLESEVNRLNNLDGGKMKKWFSDIKNSIPAFVNPITAIGAGLGKSISLGMENELQKQNITSLMGGDTASADALFGKITDYGKATVYDKAGLIDSQKTMMSFGLSSDFAFDKLKQIGDIAMGDSQKMQSLALAFSQATSAGKLQGQDLLQMINAGFNPLNEISKKTGESMTSLKQRMSEGKISADELSLAFQWATEEGGLFYQGAEKAGETVAGKWSNMKDTLSEMAIGIFNTIQPVLKPIIEFATKVFNAAAEGITWVSDKIKEGNPIILGLAAAIGVLTVALISYKTITALTRVVQHGLTLSVIESNLAFLACPLFWIIAGIVALIAAIVFLCLKVKGWGTLWEAVVTFCKETFFAFVDGVKSYFNTLVNGIMIGLDKIKLGWYKFKQAAGIGDKNENQSAIDKINSDVEARKKEITDGAKKVADHAKKAVGAFKGVNLEWDKKVSLKSTTAKLKAQLGVNTPVGSAGVSGKTDKAAGNNSKLANALNGLNASIASLNNNINNNEQPESAHNNTKTVADILATVTAIRKEVPTSLMSSKDGKPTPVAISLNNITGLSDKLKAGVVNGMTKDEQQQIMDGLKVNMNKLNKQLIDSGTVKKKDIEGLDMSKDLSTSSETISAGGKSVKNFTINFNDGLVKGVQNYFNSSNDNPDTASDFMWRLANALQLIVNDVNYAAE